jgi:hypothetical protein
MAKLTAADPHSLSDETERRSIARVAPAPVKRGRGRPRKHPLPTPVAYQQDKKTPAQRPEREEHLFAGQLLLTRKQVGLLLGGRDTSFVRLLEHRGTLKPIRLMPGNSATVFHRKADVLKMIEEAPAANADAEKEGDGEKDDGDDGDEDDGDDDADKDGGDDGE